MEDDIQKIGPCVACDSVAHRFFVTKNGFTLYRCVGCGHIVIYPFSFDTKVIYGDDYFSGADKGSGYVDYDQDKEPMRPVFKKYLTLTFYVYLSVISMVRMNFFKKNLRLKYARCERKQKKKRVLLKSTKILFSTQKKLILNNDCRVFFARVRYNIHGVVNQIKFLNRGAMPLD